MSRIGLRPWNPDDPNDTPDTDGPDAPDQPTPENGEIPLGEGDVPDWLDYPTYVPPDYDVPDPISHCEIFDSTGQDVNPVNGDLYCNDFLIS